MMNHGQKFRWTACFLLYGAFALCGAPQTHTQAPGKNEASCREFVQRFYDWYVGLDARNEKTHEARTTMDLALNLRPELFDHDLLEMLKADSAAQAKADDIVGLDFDPFLNSQDPSSEFKVERTKVDGERCRAVVFGFEQGAKEEQVEPELALRDGQWVFANFHYPQTKYHPVDENLISILKSLAADRAKPISR
jgi:hypothetical protein